MKKISFDFFFLSSVTKNQDYCRIGQLWNHTVEMKMKSLEEAVKWHCALQHCTHMVLIAVPPAQIFHIRKNSDNIASCLLNGHPDTFWWHIAQKKHLLFVVIILNLRFLFFMWLTVLRLLPVFCNPRILLLHRKPWNSFGEILTTYSKSSLRFFITWCCLVNHLKQMRPSRMVCVSH